jgi:hypothetical protein
MNQALNVAVISDLDLRKRLVAWTGCSRSSGGRDGKLMRIVADYIRHALAHSNSSESLTAQPVHVHQIRAAVRRQLGSLFQDFDHPPWEDPDNSFATGPTSDPNTEPSVVVDDLVLTTLHALARIGDCAHLGRGYYLASPVRLVTLQSGGALVIGGLPTKEVNAKAGISAHWAGISRALPPSIDPPGPSSIPRQDLHTWSNLPTAPLREWTASILKGATERGIRTAGSELTTFEVYAPRFQKAQQQKNRWIQATRWRDDPLAGTNWWLCRSRVSPRRFWLAYPDGALNGLTFSREQRIEYTQVRRLMYGLDQLADASISVRVVEAPGFPGEREVQLYSWPAWEEYQLLIALATDMTMFEQRPLPLKLRVSDLWWPDVLAALEGLGVRFLEQKRATSR